MTLIDGFVFGLGCALGLGAGLFVLQAMYAFKLWLLGELYDWRHGCGRYRNWWRC